MMFNIVLGLIIFYVVIIILHFSTSIKLTSAGMIVGTFSSVTALSVILMPLIEESFVEGALLAMLAIAVAVPIVIYQVRSCCKTKESAYETLKSIRDILIGGTICNGMMAIATIVLALLSVYFGTINIFSNNMLNLIALPFVMIANLFTLDEAMALGSGVCFGTALYILDIFLIFRSTRVLYASSEKRSILRVLSLCPIANFVVIILLLIKTAALSQKQKSQNI